MRGVIGFFYENVLTEFVTETECFYGKNRNDRFWGPMQFEST